MMSCAIISLNEESNISDCIQSIRDFGIENVFLLDGGSKDKTVSIAKGMGCVVIEMPGSSISSRRGYALEQIDAEFLLFVDADQRLCGDSSIEDLLHNFKSTSKLAGIQLRLKADPSTKGYWALGFSERLNLITGKPGRRAVIGTPCIFKKSITREVRYNVNLTGPSDDTLFCSSLIRAGYVLEAVQQVAYELVRATFRGTLKKAFWYGMGDAEYIRFDRENLTRHLYHVYVRGILIYPSLILFKKFYLTPFFIIFGVTRGVGLIYGAIWRVNLSNASS